MSIYIKITKEEVKEAYIKYKSYIYYDTSELYQRRKLAEFESNLLSESLWFGETAYAPGLKNLAVKIDNKFETIVKLLNSHHKKKGFNRFLNDIELNFLPKQFIKPKGEENFISNKRVTESYEIDKVIVIADIPVELHIVTVLWLMNYGHKLDSKLESSCMGNRLLLNKSKDGIVKGSGLFKPFFSQYQKWRDDAVEEAQRKLQNDCKVAFINLDLKDYFYSARIDFEEIEKEIWGKQGYKGGSNIHDIFKELHQRFTLKLCKTNYPYKELKDKVGNKCVLPIGIVTSYVIGNYYLREFDKRIKNLIPQIYYRRYVDDIIIILENPDFDFHQNEKCDSIRFSFQNYLKKESRKEEISYAKSDNEFNDLPKTEKFLLEKFYPLIKLVDYPDYLKSKLPSDNNEEKRIFKITCMDGAYFQTEKTMLFYFDNEESTAVIDKLKQELEERSSEFRDFPEDSNSEISFTEQAYHLIFDGTEGKIRTLKDYKENRYGLSVFLANRIFTAIRRSKKIEKEESDKILKLFKGLNNLEYFRLWEKVFTFFLVNENPSGFFAFFKHTYEQIEHINSDKIIQDSEITHTDIASSLFKYYDIALEMSIALNPSFIKVESKLYKDIKIFLGQKKDELDFINNVKLTGSDRFYITRFRKSNLIRHHYVAHPLLNYSKEARHAELNLVSSSLPNLKDNSARLELSPASLSLSPRRVKFWECCIAVVNKEMLIYSESKITNWDGRYQKTSLFTGLCADKSFILDKAFELYEQINGPHFTSNRPRRDDFYCRKTVPIEGINEKNEIIINELQIEINNKFSQNPRVSIANTQVLEKNIESSLQGEPNLCDQRFQVLAKLLRESREMDANMFLLPEFSVPYELVSVLAKYSDTNQMAIIAGLEHWNVKSTAYNFIVTIIPVQVHGTNDAIVLYRLKNHYAHIEELVIRGFGYNVPKPFPYRYDLINWRNVYFTSFYCFELADVFHRSLFRSKIDLLIASEWNKDTPYFSNIVESLSRDLHCYIAQVNTSNYGDSRLTQPTETARKDMLKLKGGINHTILVEELNIGLLREFQLKYFERIRSDRDDTFKPVPPDWNRNEVNKRINNADMFD